MISSAVQPSTFCRPLQDSSAAQPIGNQNTAPVTHGPPPFAPTAQTPAAQAAGQVQHGQHPYNNAPQYGTAAPHQTWPLPAPGYSAPHNGMTAPQQGWQPTAPDKSTPKCGTTAPQQGWQPATPTATPSATGYSAPHNGMTASQQGWQPTAPDKSTPKCGTTAPQQGWQPATPTATPSATAQRNVHAAGQERYKEEPATRGAPVFEALPAQPPCPYAAPPSIPGPLAEALAGTHQLLALQAVQTYGLQLSQFHSAQHRETIRSQPRSTRRRARSRSLLAATRELRLEVQALRGAVQQLQTAARYVAPPQNVAVHVGTDPVE